MAAMEFWRKTSKLCYVHKFSKSYYSWNFSIIFSDIFDIIMNNYFDVCRSLKKKNYSAIFIAKNFARINFCLNVLSDYSRQHDKQR